MRNGNSGRWKGENAEVDFVSRAELLVRQRKFAGLSHIMWSAIVVFRMYLLVFYLYFHEPLCKRFIFYPTGRLSGINIER